MSLGELHHNRTGRHRPDCDARENRPKEAHTHDRSNNPAVFDARQLIRLLLPDPWLRHRFRSRFQPLHRRWHCQLNTGSNLLADLRSLPVSRNRRQLHLGGQAKQTDRSGPGQQEAQLPQVRQYLQLRARPCVPRSIRRQLCEQRRRTQESALGSLHSGRVRIPAAMVRRACVPVQKDQRNGHTCTAGQQDVHHNGRPPLLVAYLQLLVHLPLLDKPE